MNLRWLLASILLLVTSPVLAQAGAADKAAAEALFDRGLQLMRDGNFSEACARLEQSQAIEHGIGTMLYLAECYERLGRTASAWALFREASSQAAAAGQTERAETGKHRAEKLERGLSKLAVDVPPGSQVPGLEVLRNGTVVAPGVWGLPVPVDPGEQRVEVKAPQHEPWSTTIQVGANADLQRVSVPPLAKLPTPPEPVATSEPSSLPPPVTTAVTPASDAQPTKNKRRSNQRLVGGVIGAAGIALLAVGGGYGVKAIIKNNDAQEDCEDNVCGPRGISLTEDANSAARIANGTLLAGGILVVAGAVVFFTAPKKERKVSMQPVVGREYAGLKLGGAF